MKPVLTAEEMREADRRTIEEIGLPGVVLMENAGTAVARAVRRRWPEARRVVVVCGKGNNGGDGFVVARRLGGRSGVLLLARRGEVKGDARVHMLALERSGSAALIEVPDVPAWKGQLHVLREADVLVDALLGTGLREAPQGLLAEAMSDVMALRASRRLPVVAVDLPSGLSSDAGEVPWPTLEADLTVTFAARKYGHVLPPSCLRAGEVLVADIGIPFSLLAGARLWLLERSDAAAAYPPRPPDAHKGRFGHVLVVAGSAGKSGAAALCGAGALLSGAGLVTVATPLPAQPLVAASRPELMTEPLSADDGALSEAALEPALALAKERDAVVLGPGLGVAPGTRSFVQAFVRRCPVPLVLDADGLNALGPPVPADALRRDRPTVLTPHPGEMARLTHSTAQAVQGRRLEAARELAARTGAVVVLKGFRTVVAQPDGPAAVNPAGGAELATGGTGDVLAGIIGSLLARGHEAWPAAIAAVYLHGWAGDLGARGSGQEAMTAGGLLESLPRVLRRLERDHRRA